MSDNDRNSADGFWYPPEVEAQMAANPPKPETLFGVPVLHSSETPCEVTIRFAHGFFIEEDDA